MNVVCIRRIKNNPSDALRMARKHPVAVMNCDQPKADMRVTKRAPRQGRRVAAPGLPYEAWLHGRFESSADAAAYLETVIEEGDQAATGPRIAAKPAEKELPGYAHCSSLPIYAAE